MNTALTSTPSRSERRPMILKSSDGDPFFQRITDIHDALARRAYELFEGRGHRDGRDMEDWLEAEIELLKPTPVEICEDDGELIVRADTPGFKEKDIELRVEPFRVIISGQREESHDRNKQKTLYSERKSNRLLRLVDLPEQVDPEKAKATLREGSLEIELPKAGPAQKVPILTRAAV